MPRNDAPTFGIVVKDEWRDDRTFSPRVRRFLKCALRSFGLRAVSIMDPAERERLATVQDNQSTAKGSM